MTARVKGRTCSGCEHAYLGPNGVLCAEFNEIVVLESIAEECSEYVALPWVKEKERRSG